MLADQTNKHQCYVKMQNHAHVQLYSNPSYLILIDFQQILDFFGIWIFRSNFIVIYCLDLCAVFVADIYGV